MPSINISPAIFERLCEINQFELPDAELVFVGIRGCIPVNYDDQSFKKEHPVNTAEINYLQMRCTLIQWDTKNDQLAVFPGSTVPHRTHVSSALAKQGAGANCLFPAFYKDYRKGMHKPESDTGHEAFRQTGDRPVRRTADDMDFDTDDRVEFTNPFDNFHAAWSGSLAMESYASAGCQVVMGYPKCKRPDSKNVGPWATFHKNAYAISQDSFPYMLFNTYEVVKVANDLAAPATAKLRFGSSGKIVKKLQKGLSDRNFYEGNIDGDFGIRSIRALLDFQRHTFGADGADGICGQMTAAELGFDLPLV